MRIEVLDSSLNIGTSIKKVGNNQVSLGTDMRYDFSDIANTSNTPLDSFYWHDSLPADVSRLKVIKTGTYNQALTYSVTYKTNLSGSYRTLASGLQSTQSYDLDCSANRLGLASGEYVTDFRFEFGTVKAGFRCVSNPAILVGVSSTLKNGYRFSNRADVGGLYQGKWITSSSTWITTVSRPNPPSYPKTGY